MSCDLTFSEKILVVRHRVERKGESLAVKVGVTRQTICGWIAGKYGRLHPGNREALMKLAPGMFSEDEFAGLVSVAGATATNRSRASDREAAKETTAKRESNRKRTAELNLAQAGKNVHGGVVVEKVTAIDSLDDLL